MTDKEYYTAPSDEVFEDIKQASILLWKTYDDTYGYASGRVERIKNIQNYKDNYAFMVALFDPINQLKLSFAVNRQDTRALLTGLITYSSGI